MNESKDKAEKRQLRERYRATRSSTASRVLQEKRRAYFEEKKSISGPLPPRPDPPPLLAPKFKAFFDEISSAESFDGLETMRLLGGSEAQPHAQRSRKRRRKQSEEYEDDSAGEQYDFEDSDEDLEDWQDAEDGEEDGEEDSDDESLCDSDIVAYDEEEEESDEEDPDNETAGAIALAATQLALAVQDPAELFNT